MFFRRHGGKTVFFGRWLPVLRVTAAWMAGASHMEWRKFAVFNALGGVAMGGHHQLARLRRRQVGR